MSDMSETLRDQHGHQLIAEEKDARDEPDQVFCAHGRPTAHRMTNVTMKEIAIRAR